MSNDKFPAETEKRGFAIIEVSSLNTDLLTFLDWISELPVPWVVKYFDNAEELRNLLSSEEVAKLKKLVAVMPSDLGFPLQDLSSAAYKSHTQLLVVIGKAYRAREDRNRQFYLRR